MYMTIFKKNVENKLSQHPIIELINILYVRHLVIIIKSSESPAKTGISTIVFPSILAEEICAFN